MYNWPHRKKLRLENYNYSQNGYYFITICCYKNQCFFWEVKNWKMILNEYWKITENEILETEKIRNEIIIDKFIIMPNHIHLIIWIKNNTNKVGNAGLHSLQNNQTLPDWQLKTKNTLSNTIQLIKSSITRKIRTTYNDFLFAWQKSFYDVIIKTDEQLLKSRQYILNNPKKWDLDMNNPDNEERVKELRKQGKR